MTASNAIRVRSNKWINVAKVYIGTVRLKTTILVGLFAAYVLFLVSFERTKNAHSIGGSSTFLSSKELERWSPGMLDIHHLQVGSSVSSFVIFPDGTTMLIDAGDLNVKQALSDLSRMGPPFDKLNLRRPYPNDSKSPAGWIVDYMRDFWPSQVHPEQELDYLLVTHFHADHIGDGSTSYQLEDRSKSSSGNYVLSGVPELASKLKIKKVIDRGYSDKNMILFELGSMEDISLKNYIQFVEENKNSFAHEMFDVGSTSQISMQVEPSKYANDFRIRVIKSTLNVTIARDDPRYPQDASTSVPTQIIHSEVSAENQLGNENTMSAAIVIEYGKFRYYEGADQEIVRNKHGDIILDTIGPTAKAAGKVDVATLNHHGHGVSQDYIKYMEPPIMVLQGWSSDQPPKKSIEMLAATSTKHQRKIFATDIFQERLDEFGPALSKLFQSTSGHVVVRVHPPPKKEKNLKQMFEIVVLDDKRKIQAHHGHFPVRQER